MKFIYLPIKFNFSSRKGSKIEFIVVHDTGNPSKGANALNHQKYFGAGNRNASAHYFTDDEGIVQIIGDTFSAWHCGDTWAKHRATRKDVFNRNSLSIEMCINADGDYGKMYKNTVELVKNLMAKFNVSADKVVRHFDASGKMCPNHMSKNNWEKWWQFKEDIKKPIEWKIDLSKNSEFGVFQEEALKEREEEVKENPDKKYEVTLPSVWAEEAWQWAKDKGITDGTNPGDCCTREEVATMLYRFAGLPKEKPT